MRSILSLILFQVFSIFSLCAQPYYDTSIPNKYVKENTFLKEKPDNSVPPSFDDIKSKLPEPFWNSNADVIKAYWEMWKSVFSFTRSVNEKNGFIAPYVDPSFNDYIFMWDECFITMYGMYGREAFNFQNSLNNFYSNQHKDGYISRQISMKDGSMRFEKYDITSTGPNIMPWAEWEYFVNVRDTIRLKRVFPPLLAYYQWYRMHKSWPDGSYYSNGWGSGIDNQPRIPQGKQYDNRFSHGFMSWIDITLQQIFVGKILICKN